MQPFYGSMRRRTWSEHGFCPLLPPQRHVSSHITALGPAAQERERKRRFENQRSVKGNNKKGQRSNSCDLQRKMKGMGAIQPKDIFWQKEGASPSESPRDDLLSCWQLGRNTALPWQQKLLKLKRSKNLSEGSKAALCKGHIFCAHTQVAPNCPSQPLPAPPISAGCSKSTWELQLAFPIHEGILYLVNLEKKIIAFKAYSRNLGEREMQDGIPPSQKLLLLMQPN